MSEDNKNIQKQDLVNIMKLSAQYEMGNPTTAGKILDYVNNKGMMTSSYGKLYTQRLDRIKSGININEFNCIICKKNVAVDGILCDACESKYSNGRLKIKKPSSAMTKSIKKTESNEVKAVKGTVQKFADKIDTLAGGEGKAEIRFRDLFKDVFKHHTTAEAEKIFICGTEITTPLIKDIKTEWPAPWLYSRVALWLFVACIILEVSWSLTSNLNLLPGLMFLGSCTVPFSLMVFFFETNVPRNISIFQSVRIFLVGGCESLLCTLVIYLFVPVGNLNFIGAILVSLVEEIGKMVIVAWFIKRMRDCRYILNGILIGSAVGAGFAVFESAGYAFRILLAAGYGEMVSNINLRALLSPGGHVAWAAVTGAAIMIALGKRKFYWGIIKEKNF